MPTRTVRKNVPAPTATTPIGGKDWWNRLSTISHQIRAMNAQYDQLRPKDPAGAKALAEQKQKLVLKRRELGTEFLAWYKGAYGKDYPVGYDGLVANLNSPNPIHYMDITKMTEAAKRLEGLDGKVKKAVIKPKNSSTLKSWATPKKPSSTSGKGEELLLTWNRQAQSIKDSVERDAKVYLLARENLSKAEKAFNNAEETLRRDAQAWVSSKKAYGLKDTGSVEEVFNQLTRGVLPRS